MSAKRKLPLDANDEIRERVVNELKDDKKLNEFGHSMDKILGLRAVLMRHGFDGSDADAVISNVLKESQDNTLDRSLGAIDREIHNTSSALDDIKDQVTQAVDIMRDWQQCGFGGS